MLEPLSRVSAIITDENDTGTFVDDAAALKLIITHDPFLMDRKFKDPRSVLFNGFMVQCVNELPKLRDKSESLYRRLLVIPFEKRFEGCERKYIKDDYLKRKGGAGVRAVPLAGGDRLLRVGRAAGMRRASERVPRGQRPRSPVPGRRAAGGILGHPLVAVRPRPVPPLVPEEHPVRQAGEPQRRSSRTSSASLAEYEVTGVDEQGVPRFRPGPHLHA